MTPRRQRNLYLFGLLMFLAVVLRTPTSRVWALHPEPIAGLLALFLLLYMTEPLLTRRFPRYLWLYLVIQTVIGAVLLLLPPSLDFFAILFILPTIQAMRAMKSNVGFLWVGIFSAVTALCLFLGLGLSEGLGLTAVYIVPYLFVAVFVLTVRQADEANARSERLLVELQQAHDQLQGYAAQAEELAASQERNRLARELHDAVAQTIFSIRLNAASARVLLEQDPSRLETQLEKLGALSESALAEIRKLIFELRPGEIERGLVHALQEHTKRLRQQDDLEVSIEVDGEGDLSPEQELLLFRIAQEALNNVIKHANTLRAAIRLSVENRKLSLEISDPGRGFDPSQISAGHVHMGLASMRERAESLGGTLQLESRPAEGTRVVVQVPLETGAVHDG